MASHVSLGGDIMISVNATSGSEVEGLRILDPLVARLMGSLNDKERATATRTVLQDALALALAYRENIPIVQAISEVAQLTEVIE